MFLCTFRAFGDKSGPPSLLDAESEGQDVNGEECEIDEKERVEEKQQNSGGEMMTDQACSGVEELSLTQREEEEEEEGEKGNDDEEAEQNDWKMTQGNIY